MNVYIFSLNIVIVSESRNIEKKIFLLYWGLLNLRARGRLTEFRFGMALNISLTYRPMYKDNRIHS